MLRRWVRASERALDREPWWIVDCAALALLFLAQVGGLAAGVVVESRDQSCSDIIH
jgi:hypothetical protein